MKTLRDIIALRGRKYADEAKNPSYTEFFQGRFDGWYSAYRDIKEILEQNGFNLDVPVIGVGKTNADHIRSMTDEELAVFIADKIPHGDCCDCYLECAVFDHSKFNNCCHNAFYKWLKQPYKEET